jgi:hypothetical protein
MQQSIHHGELTAKYAVLPRIIDNQKLPFDLDRYVV